MKIKYHIGIWSLLLFFSCCSNVDNLVPKIPTFENCQSGQYFSYQEQDSYREYFEGYYSRFVSPLRYDFFPILGFYNEKGIRIKSLGFNLIQIDSIDFLRKDQYDELISLHVDTSNYHFFALRDNTLQKQHCFKTRPILFHNNSKDKYFLPDRSDRMKLVLQGKNEKNEWLDLHDIRKIGCGLENDINPKEKLNVLPPESHIKSCFFLEAGDFETECRIKYTHYNTIDSSHFRSSNDGYCIKNLKIEELEKAIYSNTFKQKISKQRLRKAKNVF